MYYKDKLKGLPDHYNASAYQFVMRSITAEGQTNIQSHNPSKDGYYPLVRTNDDEADIVVIDLDDVQPKNQTYPGLIAWLHDNFDDKNWVAFPTISNGEKDGMRARIVFQITEIDKAKTLALSLAKYFEINGFKVDESSTNRNRFQGVYVQTPANKAFRPQVNRGDNALEFSDLPELTDWANAPASPQGQNGGLNPYNGPRTKAESEVNAMNVTEFSTYLDQFKEYNQWIALFFSYALHIWRDNKPEYAEKKIRTVNENQSEPLGEVEISELIDNARARIGK